MAIREVKAKSILRKHSKIDSWFISRYGMNFYRGCTHSCVYCDGRAESYLVEEEFGSDVTVKINAIEVLERELSPRRKRAPLKRSYIMVGGGVGDSYQPVESKYKLTRKALQLLHDYNFPVHMLTKSTLIKRDVDILKKINQKSRAVVSFSFSSASDEISAVFEPGVPAPSDRLEAISFFKREGIPCGMFLMPVIPFITDQPNMMEETIKKAREAGVDFIIFSGMTLKEGKQKEYFYNTLRKSYPELISRYQNTYRESKWGEAAEEYYNAINHMFYGLARKYKIPVRIPHTLFKDTLDENDLVVVLLEHIDYLLKMQGKKSPYGYAAHSISRLEKPLSAMKGELQSIKGIGRATESIVLEILQTGSSTYYEELTVGQKL